MARVKMRVITTQRLQCPRMASGVNADGALPRDLGPALVTSHDSAGAESARSSLRLRRRPRSRGGRFVVVVVVAVAVALLAALKGVDERLVDDARLGDPLAIAFGVPHRHRGLDGPEDFILPRPRAAAAADDCFHESVTRGISALFARIRFKNRKELRIRAHRLLVEPLVLLPAIRIVEQKTVPLSPRNHFRGSTHNTRLLLFLLLIPRVARVDACFHRQLGELREVPEHRPRHFVGRGKGTNRLLQTHNLDLLGGGENRVAPH